MPSTWFIVKPDRELGPYTSAQMKQLASSGQLKIDELVRRADQSKTVTAGRVQGLFLPVQMTDRPRTTPPPLPSERQQSQTPSSSGPLPKTTHPIQDRPKTTPPPLPSERTKNGTNGSSEPPPLPSSTPRFDEIRKKFGALTETTKAAGHLAVAEARKAKLTNLTLPMAYLALGRDIFAGGRFRSEFPELYAEIERLQAEITRLTTGRLEGKASGTLSEKAGQTASKLKDTAQAKALSLKVDSLIKRLGEIGFAAHGDKSGSEALVQQIRDSLSQIGEAQGEIDGQDANQGRRITPRRILYAGIGVLAAIVFVAFANRSSNVEVEKSVTAPSAAGGLKATVAAPPTARPVPITNIAENASGTIPSSETQVRNERPDFSKVDYLYDFSKDDMTPPIGCNLEKRFKRLEESDTRRTGETGQLLEGCWADEEGYLARDSTFILHGHRIVWSSKDKQQKVVEDSWLNGAPHGLRTFWYAYNGKKQSEIMFVKGANQGPLHRWSPDGTQSLDTAYLNGLQHGIRIDYFPNGQKKLEGAFIKGRSQGYSRGWFENGKPSEESYLVDGLFDGLVKNWPRPDSVRPDECNYNKGRRQGRSTHYFPNGCLKHDFLYDNDRLVYRRGDDIDTFQGKLVDLLNNEPRCWGAYPIGMNYEKAAFMRVFGDPDSDVGLTHNKRKWHYRCRDGLLTLTVIDWSDRVGVEDVEYSHRENTISSGMSSKDIQAALVSKVPDQVKNHVKKAGLGASDMISFGLYDADWFFGTVGYPNILTSLDDLGQRKYYAYKCADGVVGLDVMEYRWAKPNQNEVQRITIKSFDRR
jgi:antitoxin component YwqK of YwqJK toxin-antitoxin module